METYIEGLSKAEFDEFATEFFGVELDRRKSKKVMVEQFEEATKGKEPLKKLPFESAPLVVEAEEELIVVKAVGDKDPVIEPEVLESMEEVEETGEVLEVDPEFVPAWAPTMIRGEQKFANVNWISVLAWQGGARDAVPGLDSLSNDIATINHWIAKDGELLVRETRNSRFITLK